MAALAKKKKRIRAKEDIVIDTIIMVVMIFVLFVTAYPFYYTVVQAFNNGVDSSLGGVYFWPRRPSLENFETLKSGAKRS